MWRLITLFALSAACLRPAPAQDFPTLWEQDKKVPVCLPHMEPAPVVAANPGRRVNFQCAQATPLQAIEAVAFQTRIPMGIVPGRDPEALTRTARVYDLPDADARLVLAQAIEGTGYSVKEDGNALVLIAGDLEPRQRELLAHPFSKFGTGWPADKMICWGMALSGWLKVAAHPGLPGYAMSCSTSPNEQEFKLDIPPIATTEEIANQIVSQGDGGMWIFKAIATSTVNDPTEEIDILPYQHYSNRPITQVPR